MGFTPYAAISLLPTAISIALGIQAWRYRDRAGALAVLALQCAVALWSFGYAMELLESPLAWKMLWSKFQYLGIVSAPVAWFWFAVSYSGQGSHRALRLAAVPALVTLALAWTNELHGLIWASASVHESGNLSVAAFQYGPWFGLHVAYSYLLMFLASIMIVRTLLRQPLYDQQGIALILAVAAPWLGNLLHVSQLSPLYPLDLTPFAFIVSGTALTVSLRRHRFLDVVPVARATVMENMRDGVLVLDPHFRIVDVNSALLALVGRDRDELLGHDVKDAFPEHVEALAKLVSEGRGTEHLTLAVAESIRTLELHASPIEDPHGAACGRLVVAQDVTEQQAAEARIHYLAYRDSLTGLPNRELFVDRFEQALELAKRTDRLVACLFLDLDDFKKVNDHYGHDVGDDLLQQASERVNQSLRRTDTATRIVADPTLARFGGDEFVVLLQGLKTPADVAVPAERLLNALREPFVLGKAKVSVRTSVGASLWPQDGETPADLLRSADAAMYEAKRRGGDRLQFFTEQINTEVSQRLETENDLHAALEKDQFILHYQPQFDVLTGKLVGVEALLRWAHPRRGLVPPGSFIPIAEDTGLIIPIGKWVLEQASRDWRRLTDLTHATLKLAVNVSPRQFSDATLLQTVSEVLQDSELPSELLELEVTEGAVMSDAETSRETLDALRELGVKLAIDDFGMGYSSLGYMRRFAIDLLKLDRSFVADVDTAQGANLVRAMISMGHNLGLEIVAEGVETRDQMTFMLEEGCDRAQGFLLGRPLPFKETISVVRRGVHSRTILREVS